jgi:signal peptidase I
MSFLINPKLKKVKKWYWYVTIGESAESLIIALIMALIIKTSIVEAYKIPSGSMENTLLVGDFLLANKFIYGMKLPIPFTDIKLPALENPKPGDIIIFKYPNDQTINYIKRCVAVEGQTVEIKNKQLYVDGKPIPLPPEGKFTDRRIAPYNQDISKNLTWGYGIRDNMPPRVVPKGYLFAMGDNRDNSADSRFWGFLDRRLVMGRAMMIHWSWKPDPNAPEVSAADMFSIPKMIGYNIWHFPERVRWGRLGEVIH